MRSKDVIFAGGPKTWAGAAHSRTPANLVTTFWR